MPPEYEYIRGQRYPEFILDVFIDILQQLVEGIIAVSYDNFQGKRYLILFLAKNEIYAYIVYQLWDFPENFRILAKLYKFFSIVSISTVFRETS